jgi:hypothetical protein
MSPEWSSLIDLHSFLSCLDAKKLQENKKRKEKKETTGVLDW